MTFEEIESGIDDFVRKIWAIWVQENHQKSDSNNIYFTFGRWDLFSITVRKEGNKHKPPKDYGKLNINDNARNMNLKKELGFSKDTFVYYSERSKRVDDIIKELEDLKELYYR